MVKVDKVHGLESENLRTNCWMSPAEYVWLWTYCRAREERQKVQNPLPPTSESTAECWALIEADDACRHFREATEGSQPVRTA